MKPKKNLLLIRPNSPVKLANSDISLALLYLAGAVHKDVDQLVVYDENVDNEHSLQEILYEMHASGQLVVGINCLFTGVFPRVWELAQEIKELYSDVPIVTGGMHPTIYAEQIMENTTLFDAIIIGEGEEILPKVLKYFYQEGSYQDIESCYLRINDTTIYKNKRTSYIQNIDELHADFSFFDLKKYEFDTSLWWDPDHIKISRVQAPLLTSRSCPNQCNFCSMRLVMGNQCRMRSAENVFHEIEELYYNYGINYFHLADDNFTLNKKRAIDICNRVIKSGMKVYFDAYNGLSIQTLDEDLVAIMRSAGFIRVGLAVESGSDYIRNKVIGKRVSREKILDTFRLTSKYGISALAFIVIGFPEETHETLQETFDLITELEADRVSIYKAQPFYGTKLYEQVKKDNLLTSKMYQAEYAWKGVEIANDMMHRKRGEIAVDEKQQFYIQPYQLSLSELEIWYKKLMTLTEEKSKKWMEHIERLRKNVS